MRVRIMCVAALAAAALAGVSTTPAAAVNPGKNGMIAFTRAGTQKAIYVLDEGIPKRLTDSTVNADYAEWSPDGQKILYQVSGKVGSNGLWVMRADGSGDTRLTSAGSNGTWSRKGRIAYANNLDVWVMNADGTGQQSLLTKASDPAWSPDGSKLAFVRQEGNLNTEIWTANADGTGVKMVSHTGPNSADPSWSPDGTRILFTSGTQTVMVVNADGTNQHALGSGAGSELSWSPDGTLITFTYEESPSETQIWAMKADGTGRAMLTSDALDRRPKWQPVMPVCLGFTSTIAGTTGDDTIIGTSGDDVIHGRGGTDVIFGRGGKDVICGSNGVEWIYGEGGDDIAVSFGGDDILDGGDGNDVLSGGGGFDIFWAGPHDDRLSGGSGPDILHGEGGADTLDGGSEWDWLDGGADGGDTASYASRSEAVTLKIGAGDVSGSSADGPIGDRDTIDDNVENLVGGGGADKLYGSSVANRLTGGKGADTFSGAGGADTLIADDGVKDTKLDCGGGTDPAPVKDAIDPAPVNCNP